MDPGKITSTMNTENKNDKKTAAADWLTSLLTGWGIKQSWAQYIAAAIIGALAAVIALSETGCTVSASQSADGSWVYSGELVQPIIRELELNTDKK